MLVEMTYGLGLPKTHEAQPEDNKSSGGLAM